MFTADSPRIITLAITGASGAVYAVEMLRALDADERVGRVHLVASESALRVFAEELKLSGRNQLIEKLLGHASEKTEQLPEVNTRKRSQARSVISA